MKKINLILAIVILLAIASCTPRNPVYYVQNNYVTNTIIGNLNITGNVSVQALQVSNSTNNGVNTCELSGGTCTINNNRVTANTIIICTSQNGAINLGALSISARTPSVSYTVTSGSALEADRVGCLLIEPSFAR